MRPTCKRRSSSSSGGSGGGGDSPRLIRRLARATPRARRILAPLLLAAVSVRPPGGLRKHLHVRRATLRVLYDYLFWWQIVAFIALPLALLAGILRARLARASVAELVLELERARPQGIRDASSRALDDPTLELPLWLPERKVTSTGRQSSSNSPRITTEPSRDSSTRASRRRARSRPRCSKSRSWSRLPAQPRGSRSRSAPRRGDTRPARGGARVTRKDRHAADEERRRIERDLHDGAQQRSSHSPWSCGARNDDSGQPRNRSRPLARRRPSKSYRGPWKSFGSSRAASTRRSSPRTARRRARIAGAGRRFPVALDAARGASGTGRSDRVLRSLRRARERRQARPSVAGDGARRARNGLLWSRSQTTASAARARNGGSGLRGLAIASRR